MNGGDRKAHPSESLIWLKKISYPGYILTSVDIIILGMWEPLSARTSEWLWASTWPENKPTCAFLFQSYTVARRKWLQNSASHSLWEPRPLGVELEPQPAGPALEGLTQSSLSKRSATTSEYRRQNVIQKNLYIVTPIASFDEINEPFCRGGILFPVYNNNNNNWKRNFSRIGTRNLRLLFLATYVSRSYDDYFLKPISLDGSEGREEVRETDGQLPDAGSPQHFVTL